MDTMLSQIIKVVEVQDVGASIQRIADVVVAYFVPTVITLAVLTALAWHFGLASCGKRQLSTARRYCLLRAHALWAWQRRRQSWLAPVSVPVRGILIKSAEFLEKAGPLAGYRVG